MLRLLTAAALGAFLSLPALGQNTPAQAPIPTASELLQRGIFAQESSGDLDGAIKIYHQIVDSHSAPREIAAQAQYRLGTALLQKGDATSASQEIQKLAWDFPDYKELIDSAKTANAPQFAPRLYVGRDKLFILSPVEGTTTTTQSNGQTFTIVQPSQADAAKLQAQVAAEYDLTKTATVTGTAKQVQWMNPHVWITVSAAIVSGVPFNSDVRVSLPTPNSLGRSGWTRDSVKAGDTVTITGAPARDGSSILSATSVTVNGAALALPQQ